MKTPLKILLLLLGIGAAVAGVLMFLATVISAPPTPTPEDVCARSLDEGLAEFENGDYAHTDRDFDSYTDYIERLAREGDIDEDMRRARRVKAVESYGPKLAGASLTYFGRSVWDSNRIKDIETRVKDIESEVKSYVNSGEMTKNGATDSLLSGFKEILSTTAAYHDAVKLGGQSHFGSVSSARERIDCAARYRHHRFIGHVTALTDRLKSLPERIERNHYGWVNREVRNAETALRTNPEEVAEKISRADRAISEYTSSSSSLYGQYARDISDLRQRLNEIRNQIRN